MKRFRYILCALGVSLSIHSAIAVEKAKVSKEKPISLSKIHQKYKKAGSVEAEFTQEVYQATLARTKTSKGSFKISKPNFVRWETYEPEASLMVSNGRKLFYYNPDARGKGKGQVIERKGSEIQKQPLFQILAGLAPLEKQFTVEKTEPHTGLTKEIEGTTIRLKPKSAMGDLEAVVLKIDKKSQIQEILLENQSGNKTKITLQNQLLGAKFPPELFDFKPPPETEVLKN
jgi:outer membrane lipoprotein carrier protein